MPQLTPSSAKMVVPLFAFSPRMFRHKYPEMITTLAFQRLSTDSRVLSRKAMPFSILGHLFVDESS